MKTVIAAVNEAELAMIGLKKEQLMKPDRGQKHWEV
jgi:hypothetical protein